MQELSRRESEVAGLVAEELSNRAIAARLFISERTAEYHVEQIRNKLGFHSRTQVATWVREREQAGQGRIRGGNLPVQLTSFIGREAELAELGSLLHQQRLVTLTGPAGVGKTRLALKLAAGLSWPDGAWFIDLGPLRDPDQVWGAIAGGLEVPVQLGGQPSESVGSHFATRSSLVVVDNAEHLVTSVAGAVAELLCRCQNVRVLATSREPLGVGGEATWAVTGLQVPATTGAALEELQATEAVALFVERGRLARPAFELTEANAAAVAEITIRLDGLPLALELAAARVRTMSPAEVRERLRDRFRLLTGGGRGSLRRHQTLHAAVDWSYGLLDSDERAVFDRIGVFAASFSLDAAEQVCSDVAIPSDRVWDILSRLVEKSMVQHQETPFGSRYRLLESLRDFALDRCLQGGTVAELRRRHANYFLALAERVFPMLKGPAQREFIDRLEEDHENFRAAHEWLREESPELCLRLADALRCFWLRNEHLAEGRAWASEALAGSTEPRWARGWLLWTLSQLDAVLGEIGPARMHAEAAVTLLSEEGDLAGVCCTLAWASAPVLGGDPALAERRSAEAIEAGRACGDDWALSVALNSKGTTLVHLGKPEEAVGYLEEALTCIRRAGDAFNVANTLDSLASAQFDCGDLTCAARLWAEALRLSVSLKYSVGTVCCIYGFLRLPSALDPCRPVRLAGGAAAALQGAGAARVFINASAVDGIVAKAWQDLGDEVAERAWREGAAMSVEDLVSYALNEPLLAEAAAG